MGKPQVLNIRVFTAHTYVFFETGHSIAITNHGVQAMPVTKAWYYATLLDNKGNIVGREKAPTKAAAFRRVRRKLNGLVTEA